MSGLRVALRGGVNYGEPSESFPVSSLAAARDMWIDRRDSNGRRTCDDTDAYGEVIRVFFPCWGDSPCSLPGLDSSWTGGHAWVMTARDDADFDPEYDDPFGSPPDYRLVIGPRGGVRWERC